MVIFPNCKVNLGLNILRKREDGFHDLETVFYPLPLRDILEINRSKEKTGDTIQLSITGLDIDADGINNLCIKAYELLKKRFPDLPPVRLHLHKIIPAGGGLGGGSADASFTLLLLNKMFALGLSAKELMEMGLQLGSDCPFFILNKPCIAKGRGEILEEITLDLSAYKFIIVNPGIHVETGAMFKQIKPAIPSTSLKDLVKLPVEKWKDVMTNDFEEIVFTLHPEIANIKNELYKAGAVYASMSGSGSTVYGIFLKQQSPALSFPANYFMKELVS